MRQTLFAAACLATVLGGCGAFRDEPEVERAADTVDAVEVIGSVDLSEAMMRSADPHEAVAYFSRSADEEPDRIDLRRGLAASLERAGDPDEAVAAWEGVVAHPAARPEDRVALAKAQIRTGDWDAAGATLADIPESHESGERYRLAAMVADSAEDWARADELYGRAVRLGGAPAGILNNWGFSKLTRGDAAGAEQLFVRALAADPSLFTAKNNLVLARGARRNYDLPIVEMTQRERAMLQHTAALAAVKQGDVATGRALLRDAVETHPQHFEAAARSLDALEAPAE
jgi:Flp pilus assembly protein TadD